MVFNSWSFRFDVAVYITRILILVKTLKVKVNIYNRLKFEGLQEVGLVGDSNGRCRVWHKLSCPWGT